MKLIRFVLAGVALVLSVAWVQAQEQPKTLPTIPPPKELIPIPVGPPRLSGELLTAKGLDKLSLSKEQKADYDKLADEYKKKQKELQAKQQDVFKSADPNAFKAHFEAQQKLRPDYLSKVEKLLTEEQKKTFETVRNEQPIVGPGIGGLPLPVTIGPHMPLVGMRFLPTDAQKTLKLTDEQRKKVEELQKDLESKIMGLLTDEQKKAFDELKNRPLPGVIAPPKAIDLPKLPLPGGDKQVSPLPPTIEPARPPEVKKLDK